MTDRTEQEIFTQDELRAIHEAAAFFEDPGVFAKGLNRMGQPLEFAQKRLPESARAVISRASKVAIEKALTLSIKTIPTDSAFKSFSNATFDSKRSGIAHTCAATVIGGFGGFFGLAALPLELPIATMVMLRLIVDIAQNYGNDLSAIETRLECMYVFTLGSKSNQDDAVDSAYYTSRVIFGELVKKVSAYISATGAREVLLGIERGTTPLLIRFITEIAAQFEIRITKKFLLQAISIMGAVGGAGINLLFTHFVQ